MTPESEIREKLAEILDRPEFGDAGPSWWDLFARMISDWIDRIARLINPDLPQSAQRGVGDTAIVVLLILLLVAILWVVFRIRRVIVLKRAGLTEDIGLPPATWEARYKSALATGDTQEAFRCLWRLTVAELDKAGRLIERRGLTSGEAVLEAGLSGPAFVQFTKRFDQAMYANRKATESDLTDAQGWRNEIKAEVKR